MFLEGAVPRLAGFFTVTQKKIQLAGIKKKTYNEYIFLTLIKNI
jgi:hypothetical protein